MSITSIGFSESPYLKQSVVFLWRRPARVPFLASQSEWSLLGSSIHSQERLFPGPVATAGRQKRGDRVEAKLIHSYYSWLISLFPVVPLAAHACICFRKIKARREYCICKAKKQNVAFIVVNSFGPAN